jgi:N-acetyl-alpha-D-glucosaminyl L-malate synthase BshA
MTTKTRSLGIVCYPSSGGSGIVATELGLQLAQRGWRVHFITHAQPLRLKGFEENVYFHQVQTDNYPVFHHPPYTLSLAVKITEVVDTHGLDILHVHYAIPHATCAYLAKQMLLPRKLPVVTTLHGTDITLVGTQPSFHKITRFSIEQSDRVTAVSDFLKQKTIELFGVEHPIEVIPNFVDTDLFRPRHNGGGPRVCAGETQKIVMHASNFRPVKNIPSVLKAFARIHAEVPSRLVLVGDGPERWQAQNEVRALGISDDVHFLGVREGMADLLGRADLYLLPSEHESFGLSALEAMSCEVPVIATSVGGTNEVIEHGVSGFLVDPHDPEEMARIGIEVLRNPERQHAIGRAARARVEERFGIDRVIRQYESLYEGALREMGPS